MQRKNKNTAYIKHPKLFIRGRGIFVLDGSLYQELEGENHPLKIDRKNLIATCSYEKYGLYPTELYAIDELFKRNESS